MTKIKATLDKIETIITNLVDKLDIANLGNWATEKKEIQDLLTYLQDKSQPKPTGADDIEIDLTEIEALETTLKNLTDENTRLTTENATLTTKTSEQDGIIKNTTIPEIIAKLEQYANKVSDGELKTVLTKITTELASVKNNQEEQIKNPPKKQGNDYWTMGASILGGINIILLSYLAFFKSNKQEKTYDFDK